MDMFERPHKPVERIENIIKLDMLQQENIYRITPEPPFVIRPHDSLLVLLAAEDSLRHISPPIFLQSSFPISNQRAQD